MRAFLWILLFLFGVAGVIIPVSLLYVASGLPPLDNAYSVETQLRQYIEGERTGARAGQVNQIPATWPRPDFNQLPSDLVALYLSQQGCPNYFRSPRETGLQMAWRAFDYLAFKSSPKDPNGRCEFRFAYRIAQALRIKDPAQLAIAAYKIEGFLQRPDLVAFDLASTRYAQGVIGLDDAVRVLFGKRLDELTLADDAELAVAMPPNDYYTVVKACVSSPQIKQARDGALRRLANDNLVSVERAKLATDQPLACLHRP